MSVLSNTDLWRQEMAGKKATFEKKTNTKNKTKTILDFFLKEQEYFVRLRNMNMNNAFGWNKIDRMIEMRRKIIVLFTINMINSRNIRPIYLFVYQLIYRTLYYFTHALYIYIYIYRERERERNWYVRAYTPSYVCVCMCVFIYVCMYVCINLPIY